MAYDIRNVKNITDLICYFSQNLNWEIDIDDFETIEDISYDFSASDIGLKEESFAKISSLRQLQPLVDKQKWGIFCIEFDSNKFEVSALRKILSSLVPKRRNSIDHAVWRQQDLLFICNWGQENNKTIGVAHFEDNETGLPLIKMISCAPALEDFTQIKVFEDRLSKLSWPKNPSNIEEWRKTWASAFTTAYRQAIHDSSTLTMQLAAEAQEIRNRILSILEVEADNGYVHQLYSKFKDNLIRDMNETQFADMYAQTIVYGLFSARCMDESQGDFSALEAVDCIPSTNPFLKGLMKESLDSSNKKLSFDELEIQNVVDLLKNTYTDNIIKDFNRQTGGGKEDPVIHFYEEFLTAYDKTQKVQRGVYYTPQPIVNFMVRGVDYILKKEFGYEEGLASTDTKRVKTKRTSKKKKNGYYPQVEEIKEVPAVQILDPATGTGTYVRQIILQIYENFISKRRNLSKDELNKDWCTYVDKNLLPRLNAFELMMAPYAVTHMKLAMVLKDTGYDFSGSHRLNVFLTNTLEEAGIKEISLFDDPLSLESMEANMIKDNKEINIIIGNPPYSGVSANNGKWISELIDDYKYIDGEYFNEKKHWLNDDYVKFIRWAQRRIHECGEGIIAYINPHGYIDNPTFRAMRWNLLQDFQKIFVLNLHGNVNRKETSPDGSKDENVFDIQQGVSISFMIKKKNTNTKCEVYYSDIYGIREKKYELLSSYSINDIKWEKVSLTPPFYLFKPSDIGIIDEYEKGFKIDDLFLEYTSGIITSRDELVIDFEKEDLIQKITKFSSPDYSDDEIRKIFWCEKKTSGRLPGDSSVWSVSVARNRIMHNKHEEYIRKITYRPFDFRFIYYSDAVVHRTREKVIGGLSSPNIAIITARSNKSGKCDHFYITEDIAEAKCGESTTQSAIFPLYIDEGAGLFSHPNFNSKIIDSIKSEVGLKYNENKRCVGVDNNVFGPYDLVFYIYALMYSRKYREKYKEKLSIDFPRIPYPKSIDSFNQLIMLGEKLKDIHLMKYVEKANTGFNDGNNIVEQYKYNSERINVNKSQFFNHIKNEYWEFSIGGYQPLQKWLKDRKGRKLTENDIIHFEKIIYGIEQTIKIMDRIDEIINF